MSKINWPVMVKDQPIEESIRGGFDVIALTDGGLYLRRYYELKSFTADLARDFAREFDARGIRMLVVFRDLDYNLRRQAQFEAFLRERGIAREQYRLDIYSHQETSRVGIIVYPEGKVILHPVKNGQGVLRAVVHDVKELAEPIVTERSELVDSNGRRLSSSPVAGTRTVHFHQLLVNLFERLKEKRVAPSYLDKKIALVLNNINDESRSGRYILKWLYNFAGEVNDASWLCDTIEVALPSVYAVSHIHDLPDENEQHERLKIMLQMLGFAERYWIGMICGTSGVDARTKHWVHKKYLRYVVLPVIRQAHSFYESRDLLSFLSGLIKPDALDLTASMRWVKDMEAVRKEIVAKPQVQRQIARDRKRVRRQSLEIPEIPARELSLEERISLAPEISHDAMRHAQKDLGQLILSLKEIEPFIMQEITFLAESKGGQKAYRHILKVTDIAERFAMAYGLSQEQQYIIRLAGLVHDDGKFRTDVKDILVTSQKSKEDFNEWEREILKRHEELSLSLLEKVWLDVPFIVHILLYGPERYLTLKPVIRQFTPFTWEDLITTQILFRLSDKFAALTEPAEGRPYRPEEARLRPGGIRAWIEEEKGNFLWIPELDAEKIIAFFENELRSKNEATGEVLVKK